MTNSAARAGEGLRRGIRHRLRRHSDPATAMDRGDRVQIAKRRYCLSAQADLPADPGGLRQSVYRPHAANAGFHRQLAAGHDVVR